jgi:hypothetical protein
MNCKLKNANGSLFLTLLGSTAFFFFALVSLCFLILYTVGRTPWTGDQPLARPLPTHRRTQTQNKHTQISMPPVGFESTVSVLDRTKIVRALDRAATVFDYLISYRHKISEKI